MALWKPTDLGSSLKGWFDGADAASVTISGSGVSAWTNKGVDAFALFQSDDALKPTYASNVLTFAHIGTVGPHFLATNALTDYDVLIVGKPFAFSDTTDWRTFVLSGTQNNILIEDSSNRYGTYNGGFYPAGTLTWDNVAGLSYARVSAGNPLQLSRDGGPLFDPGANPNDTTIGGIGSGGSYNQGAINQAWGDLYELCFVPYNSSVDVRQKLEGYAAWKWGLAALLPVDHPYKNAAPTVAALHFPMAVVDTSTVTALWFRVNRHLLLQVTDISTVSTLGFRVNRRLPLQIVDTSTVLVVGFRVGRRLPLQVVDTSTVLALRFGVGKHLPLQIVDISTVSALTYRVGQRFGVQIADTSTVSALGYRIGKHLMLQVVDTSSILTLGYRVGQRFGVQITDTSIVLGLNFRAGQRFGVQVIDTSTVSALGYRIGKRFPLAVVDISTVLATNFSIGQRLPVQVADTSTVLALGFRVKLGSFSLIIADTSTVSALGYRISKHLPLQVADASTVLALGFRIGKHFAVQASDTSIVLALGFRIGKHFPLQMIDVSTIVLGFENIRRFPVQVADISTVFALGFRLAGLSFPVITGNTTTTLIIFRQFNITGSNANRFSGAEIASTISPVTEIKEEGLVVTPLRRYLKGRGVRIAATLGSTTKPYSFSKS